MRRTPIQGVSPSAAEQDAKRRGTERPGQTRNTAALLLPVTGFVAAFILGLYLPRD